MTKKLRGRKPLHGNKVKKVIKLAIKGKTEKQIVAEVKDISHSSVSKIKRNNRVLIAESKARYIKLIDKTIGDPKQVEVLKDCLNAETEMFNFRGEVVGSRADHKLRLETVKYLDKLKGREDKQQALIQNNVQINKMLDQYSS